MMKFLFPQFSSVFRMWTVLSRLPLSAGYRLIFYQFSDPSWQRGPLFLGRSGQTLVVDSHILSLTHIFIPKPITETLLGLIQIQSQPLELEGGISLIWTAQMEIQEGKLSCCFQKKGRKACQGRAQHSSTARPSVSPHAFLGVQSGLVCDTQCGVSKGWMNESTD